MNGHARISLAVAISLAACGGSPQATANPTSPASAAASASAAKQTRLDLARLDPEFGRGVTYAIGAIVRFLEPRLEGERVVFQGPPDGDAAFSFLVARRFAPTDTHESFPVPDTCAAVRPERLAGVEVCAEGEQCTPVDDDPGPVVVCDVAYIDRLMLMLRVLHTPELLLEYGTTDAGYMKLVDEVHNAPASFDGKLANPGTDHIESHVLVLATYLLATELAMLTNTAPAAELPDVGPASLSCRAERSWKSHGLWAEAERLPPFAPGAPDDTTETKAIAASWSRRLEADDRALSALRGITILGLQRKTPPNEMLNDYLIVTLMVPAMLDWYHRLGPFVAQTCAHERDQPFVLTRCLCADAFASYRAAMALVDLPEPPVHARVAAMTSRLIEQIRGIYDRQLSEQQDALLDVRLRLLSASVETSAKLARGACVASIAASAAKPGTEFLLVMGFPAVEGFQGLADQADAYGMPLDFMKLSCDGAALQGK